MSKKHLECIEVVPGRVAYGTFHVGTRTFLEFQQEIGQKTNLILVFQPLSKVEIGDFLTFLL